MASLRSSTATRPQYRTGKKLIKSTARKPNGGEYVQKAQHQSLRFGLA